MIVHPHMIQGSEEWHTARRGRVTASRFKDVVVPSTGALSKNKKGDSLSEKAQGYIAELIGETFVPEWVDFAGNKFTDRGNEMEPMAREAFEKHTKLSVAQVGFCTRADGTVGASPDGLITGPDGQYVAGLEIKCPSPKVHVGWVMAGGLPDDHKAQVHGGMAVTGLDEWHFFSFFPGLQPHHIIVRRDEYTARLSVALDEFLIEYGAARVHALPKLQLAQP